MVWEKRYMCIGKIIKNVFVFLKFGGLGILIFVYFIVSKTWQDLKKPVPAFGDFMDFMKHITV